jgi:hypothetical protein
LSKAKVTLTAQSGSLANWWLAFRYGSKPAGTVYNALVSDLAAGDYLVGARATVVSTGSTTSGNRTLTLSRLGVTWTAVMPASSGLQIIR